MLLRFRRVRFPSLICVPGLLSHHHPVSQEQRAARTFPEEAILHCRSGLTALKGNLPELARGSLLRALGLNPMIWEAFEGLCSLGAVPEIEELFPSRPPPIKRTSPDDQLTTKTTQPPVPTATGAGLFTPDTGNAGNLFRRQAHVDALPVRMGRLGPRDSMWASTQLYPIFHTDSKDTG